MPDASLILLIRDVSVVFNGLRALDAVTVAVPAEGVTAFMGPNGAGKTTLLNCVSGTCRHRGEIVFAGRALRGVRVHDRHRRGIARTYQTPVLMDQLDVLDNVMLGAHGTARGWVGGRGGAEREGELRARALALLDRFGMAALARRPARDLPHADRRRVETARALIGRPRLLLLDEPAAGLDDDEAADLMAVAREGAGAVLLVSHDLPLVRSTARTVVVLSAGRVLAVGTPDRVAADPRVVEAYLGADVDGPSAVHGAVP